MATTYQALIDAVKSMSGRTDQKTISNIPAFITAAQTKLDSRLRIRGMIETKIYAGAGLTVPLEFLGLDSVIMNESMAAAVNLANVTRARSIQLTTNDQGRAIYALSGQNIELPYTCDLIVTGYIKPPRLSESTPTNAYTEHAENAMLWHSLSYLGVFTRDAKAAQAWGAMATEETDTLNAADQGLAMATGVDDEQPHRRYF